MANNQLGFLFCMVQLIFLHLALAPGINRPAWPDDAAELVLVTGAWAWHRGSNGVVTRWLDVTLVQTLHYRALYALRWYRAHYGTMVHG